MQRNVRLKTWSVILLLMGRVDAADLLFETPVQPAQLTGCVLENGVLRLPDPLPTQVDGEAVAVEAEAYQSVKWQGESRVVTEATGAAAGRCIAFVSEAVYHFAVTRAGEYRYWQRAWIPRRASWSHSVQIDDSPPMQLRFGTRKEDVGKTWFWIAGARQHLEPGVHTLAVRDLHNGKRIDRWVLVADGAPAPTGDGPPATPVKQFDRGQFLSAPIAPLSLEAWRKLDVSSEGQVQVEIATGSGPFQALPSHGRLEGGASPLRVRACLTRTADRASPTAKLGVVQYSADADDFYVLRNAAMELLLHRETGRICGLRDPRSGRRYLPDGMAATLFELELKGFDEPAVTRLSSDEARLVAAECDGSTASLQYALVDGRLQVTVDVRLTSDWMARLGCHIANRTDRDVIALTFPRLSQARAGSDGTDDTLCFPSMTGRLIPRPGRAGTVTNIHPIRTTIGFCDLHDETGGLTLAPLDYPMALTVFKSAADPDGQSTMLSLTRRDRVKAGAEGRFTAGLGVHEGDWHVAADWYRDWFAQNVGRPQIPSWVRGSDGWVTSPHVEDMAGLGFVHMQMWRETGYGGCPTYYYLNPRYRSEDAFKELARSWRGLGGHLGVYYHGNGMSRSYILADRIYGIPVSEIPARKRPPSWEWFVRNHGYGLERKPIEKLDMTTIEEPAKHEEYPGMCWQAGDWPTYLEKWAIDVYLKEYGLDTPYWDTLGCRDVQDFSPYFSHNGEGRGAMARYRFLLEMQKKGAASASGFYQLVEGGSELLGLVAGQLQSNFVKNLEVGRYTHPDQIYYVGHSNGWWNPPRTHLAACMAFYLNTKLDLIRLTPKVMEVVRCRRWLAPWLYHSRFMDTLGLTLSSSSVKGALHVHRGTRGDALIATFMNWKTAQGETAVVDVGRYLSGPSIRAYRVTQSGEPTAMPAQRGTKWTLQVADSPVSAVLFLAEPDRARPVVQAMQKEARQHVRLFDPAGTKRRFRVTIETAEARFKPRADLGDTNKAFVLGSPPAADRCAYGREIGYLDYPTLTQRRHADLTLTEGDLVLRTRSLVVPHFPDPSFEAPRFDAAEAHTGKRSLRITPAGKLTHFPLELIPGHRYRISLWVKRLETKGHVYANVHHHLINKSHAFGGRAKPGAWQRIETVFEMKPGRGQPHLYMYNWQGTTKPAWFDTVKVEDLGPASAAR